MKRDPWPWIILGLGFALLLVYAWPGYMSIDSSVQLLEGRGHKYTDWHPPVMAWLWGHLDRIVSGPALMLLAQAAAFGLGLFRILARTFRPRTAAILAVLIFLFPPTLAPMAVIWKDSQMAGYLMLGTSLLFAERRRWRVVGVALITLGCAVRYNAPAATLPLLLLFEWRTGQRWLARIAIAGAVWVASTAVAASANKYLTDQKSYTWHAAIAPYDIAGILANTHAYHDAVLAEIFDGTPIQIHDHFELTARRLYSPVSWWNVTNGEGRMFNWPENQGHRDALERAWSRLVRDNKWPYVHHRLRVFHAILGLRDEPLFAAIWTGEPSPDYKNALKLTFDQSSIQKTMADAMTYLANDTGLFRPYIYFFIALLLLPLAWRYRDLRAYLASGILYELSFLPFGAPDVRYSHWMMVMTILATIVLFQRRRATA